MSLNSFFENPLAPLLVVALLVAALGLAWVVAWDFSLKRRFPTREQYRAYQRTEPSAKFFAALLAWGLFVVGSGIAYTAAGLVSQHVASGSHSLPAPAADADFSTGAALRAPAVRQVTASAATKASVASSSGSLKFVFGGTGLYGYALGKIYTGTGSKVVIAPGWGWSGFGEDAVSLHVSVQRDTGSGWRTLSTTSYPVGEVKVTVPTFKTTSKQQTVRYRLYSAAYTSDVSTVQNDSYSQPVTVVYENQAKYTGLAKEMYGYMKAYCPQVAVHSVKLISGRGDLAGQASGASQFVQVKAADKSMSAAYKRSVALHECGHIHQWLNYGANYAGDQLAAKAEVKYFVNDNPPHGVGWPYTKARPAAAFSALEHAADCGSIAVNPAGYLGYGGYCNASERKRAKALLQGKQYNLQPAIKS